MDRRRSATSGATNYAPRLAEGLELLGEYEGSGYEEPRYLVRRSDGQMIQLDELMYLLVEEIDGSRSYEEVGERVTERYDRRVSGSNVRTLIDKSLRPDGIVQTDGEGPPVELEKADPLLRIKMRITLIPERAVNVIASLLRPLYWPPVIIAVVAGTIALDIWYFGVHGVGQGMRGMIYKPLLVLLIYGLLIVSVGWHELGHATACKYGGATPGKVGFGVYIVWPAFYTDVTDVYRLGKAGRIRTDLGGIYFNAIFSLAVGGVYFLTGFEPILVLIVVQHLLIVYQFMPFLRLDGYFVISDATGVPDLFGRIKPTLKSLMPKEEAPKKVRELKRWVRVVVTVWVLMVIPVVGFIFVMMVISAPRLIATGWDSLVVQSHKFSRALGDGKIAMAAVGSIQMGMIVLPVTGMSVTFTRVVKRGVKEFKKLTSQKPLAAAAVGLAALVALALGAYVLWPSGEYRPIQPSERWTFHEAVEAAAQVPTGRPSLTEEREEKLEGAPFQAPQAHQIDQDVPEPELPVVEKTPTPRSSPRSSPTSSPLTEDETPQPSLSPGGQSSKSGAG